MTFKFSYIRHLRVWRRIVLFFGLVLINGCSTAYMMRGAEKLKEEEKAVLSDNFPTMTPWITVVAVDGISRGVGWYSSYELVPGRRSISVRGNGQLNLFSDTVVLTFIAVQGRKYELKFERLPTEYGAWRAWIEDASTGDVVSEKL